MTRKAFLFYTRAIPHNSKCRYGERGAAAAKPKAQIILDAAKVSAASGGYSEPKQGQRPQSARGFCPRSTMRVPQPDIIEHFGNADAVPHTEPQRGASERNRRLRRLLARRSAGAVLKPSGGNCAALRHRRTILALLACVPLTGYILRQRDRQGGPFVIGAAMERYRKTPTPPMGFSCPLGVFTQVVLGVVFRQSTTASKPLKRRPAIIGRACAGLNCRVNARKSPTL